MLSHRGLLGRRIGTCGNDSMWMLAVSIALRRVEGLAPGKAALGFGKRRRIVLSV